MPNIDFNLIFKSEVIGVWIVKSDTSKKGCLLAKLPSTVAKSLRDGCKVELYFGLTDSYAALALKIYDAVDAPLLVPMPLRTSTELQGCYELFDSSELSISIFDEFDAMIMSGTVAVTREGSSALTKSDLSAVRFPNSIEQAEEILSKIYYAINRDYGASHSRDIKLDRFTLTLGLNPMLVISADETSIFNYDINDKDEGSTQEKHLYQQLQLYFGREVYLSPQVEVGNKTRELIDVLVQDLDFTYLFESKALCVNVSSVNSYDKKVGKVVGHCEKALKQIEGAAKNYRKKLKLTTKLGGEICRKDDKNVIGVIVISEFLPHEKWSCFNDKLQSVSASNKICIVVIDAVELIKNIKISKHKKVPLSHMLIHRFEASRKHGTLHIISQCPTV